MTGEGASTRGRKVGSFKLEDRTKVLHAAAYLFDRKGYAETTMQDISARLKISKPTLYAYAKSKGEILQGIVAFWIDQVNAVVEAAEAHGEPGERLGVLVHGWAGAAVRYGPHMAVFLSEEHDIPGRALRDYRIWSRTVLHRVRSLVESGPIQPGANATVTAFAVIGFVTLLPRWFNPKGGLTIEQVAASFLATIGRS